MTVTSTRDDEPWVSAFADDYGRWPTQGDPFWSIALDEAHHRDGSERRVDRARFGCRQLGVDDQGRPSEDSQLP